MATSNDSQLVVMVYAVLVVNRGSDGPTRRPRRNAEATPSAAMTSSKIRSFGVETVTPRSRTANAAKASTVDLKTNAIANGSHGRARNAGLRTSEHVTTWRSRADARSTGLAM